jgi:molecular chaperone DnaK
VVTTVQDSQKSIELDIRLGEGEKAADNYALSSIQLADINPAPKGVTRVRLTFYAYANSVFEIGVCYKESGPEQKISIIPSSGMSAEQIKKIQKMVARYAEECKPQELETLAGAVIPLPETAQQEGSFLSF